MTTRHKKTDGMARQPFFVAPAAARPPALPACPRARAPARQPTAWLPLCHKAQDHVQAGCAATTC